MPIQAHRDGDARACGARTTVTGQSTVFVNGKLWAVDRDPNSHGSGPLKPSGPKSVTINGKPVIVHTPDPVYSKDNQDHLGSARTNAGSGNVFAY